MARRAHAVVVPARATYHEPVAGERPAPEHAENLAVVFGHVGVSRIRLIPIRGPLIGIARHVHAAVGRDPRTVCAHTHHVVHAGLAEVAPACIKLHPPRVLPAVRAARRLLPLRFRGQPLPHLLGILRGLVERYPDHREPLFVFGEFLQRKHRLELLVRDLELVNVKRVDVDLPLRPLVGRRPVGAHDELPGRHQHHPRRHVPLPQDHLNTAFLVRTQQNRLLRLNVPFAVNAHRVRAGRQFQLRRRSLEPLLVVQPDPGVARPRENAQPRLFRRQLVRKRVPVVFLHGDRRRGRLVVLLAQFVRMFAHHDRTMHDGGRAQELHTIEEHLRPLRLTFDRDVTDQRLELDHNPVLAALGHPHHPRGPLVPVLHQHYQRLARHKPLDRHRRVPPRNPADAHLGPAFRRTRDNDLPTRLHVGCAATPANQRNARHQSNPASPACDPRGHECTLLSLCLAPGLLRAAGGAPAGPRASSLHGPARALQTPRPIFVRGLSYFTSDSNCLTGCSPTSVPAPSR